MCDPRLPPYTELDQLADIQFTPATYPDGFPPPAPPIPTDILAWQTSFPLPLDSQAAFSQLTFYQSLEFKYEPTLLELTSVFDHLPTPTLPDDDNSDIMSLISTQSFTSQWGRSVKLAKYLFIGHFLVRTPINPFFVPVAVSRQLITTSFLRALCFNQKTYEQLSSEPLTIVNENGSKTVMGWPYLRNHFLDFYIDITLELRKITQGSTSPLAGFVINDDQKMEKIFDLIVTFNSAGQKQVQGAICDLIGTQAFKEVLWAVLFQPITELTEGNARLADLYPNTIQTWTAPELYPRIMAALDEMYMHPDRFATFFQVVHELPSLQEANVLIMDPKNKVPKHMTDEMGVRRMKTLNDIVPIDVTFTSNFEVPHA
ncbi:hypothetical protein F4604DRAFT_1677466 [Suillus subluteus]|nr:hypothetical protein F4604DRAFT_1677466 [Suillus subluteus]